MDSNFQYYRDAAKSISAGWLQWAWQNDNEKCLVQVLRNIIGSRKLPASVVAELDGELDYFRDYRIMRTTFRLRKQPLEGVFVVWNDLPWRRKQDVLRVLENLADRLEQKEEARISSERDRLTTEVERLRPKVKEMEDKIHDLEEKNGILKRLTTASTLRADRENLQELSDELNARYKELEKLKSSGEMHAVA